MSHPSPKYLKEKHTREKGIQRAPLYSSSIPSRRSKSMYIYEHLNTLRACIKSWREATQLNLVPPMQLSLLGRISGAAPFYISMSLPFSTRTSQNNHFKNGRKKKLHLGFCFSQKIIKNLIEKVVLNHHWSASLSVSRHTWR